MRYRMSVIYGHPVMTATRTLRFSDHVTKRNGGSGDENVIDHVCLSLRDLARADSDKFALAARVVIKL